MRKIFIVLFLFCFPFQSHASENKEMTIEIPKLKITAPIKIPLTDDEAGYQKALLNGVGMLPGSAEPGGFGNLFIFGHSSDYFWSKGKFKKVFAGLPKLQKDDEVKITSISGETFTYVVTSKKVVKPNDLSVTVSDKTVKVLTLQTSYPIGWAFRRLIVICHLKEVN